MIDLHTHTTESDGTLSPIQLVDLARKIGVEALAITDHDTFSGYDQVQSICDPAQLELICGIELSTRFKNRSVHLLGYFLNGQPTEAFRQWVIDLQTGRHSRNRLLVAKLKSMGMEITLDEVMQRGRKLPGRPHFAVLMLEKGYVSSLQDAFNRYLDESAECFVPRDEPTLEEALTRIIAAGGLPSLPHPLRISSHPDVIGDWVQQMQDLGLKAIEVYHSDHCQGDISFFSALANRFGLDATGGSDFHGDTKPGISLGIGRGTLKIDLEILRTLRLRSR